MVSFIGNEIQEKVEDDGVVMEVKDLGLRRYYSALSRRITSCLNRRLLTLQDCKVQPLCGLLAL